MDPSNITANSSSSSSSSTSSTFPTYRWNESRQVNLIIGLAFCAVIAFAAVLLRLLARRRLAIKLQADDWWIMGGLVMVLAAVISSVYEVHYGLGLHVERVTDRAGLMKSVIATEAIYAVAILPIKLSMLALYNRLFPFRDLYYIILATGIFIISYSVIQFICIMIQCLPLSTLWTGDGSSGGTCIDLPAALFSFAIMNIVTDTVLLAIPMPFVWGLQLRRGKRLELFLLFGLGFSVTGVSIARTVLVHRDNGADADVSWSNVDLALVSIIEVALMVLAACLPTYRPLFRARVVGGSAIGSGSGSGSGSRSRRSAAAAAAASASSETASSAASDLKAARSRCQERYSGQRQSAEQRDDVPLSPCPQRRASGGTGREEWVEMKGDAHEEEEEEGEASSVRTMRDRKGITREPDEEEILPS